MMKTSEHLRHDYLLETFARGLAREVGCRRLARKLAVYWNTRRRTTAGMSCSRRLAIFLNPRLVEVSASEVQRTLRHELAHLVAHERAGRRRISAHGPEWRVACEDLGIPGESRCHNLPFKTRRLARKYFYQCPECGVVLRRVRKIKRAVACLSCCKRHNRGRYHSRFRLTLIGGDSEMAA